MGKKVTIALKMTKKFTTDNELVAQWASVVFTCGLLLVLGCTLFPFDFSFGKIVNTFEYLSSLSDALANVLLFIPFSFGLTGLIQKRKLKGIAPLIVVLAASFGLSLTVEILQMFLPLRTPNLADIVTNSTGGFLGFVCFRLWRIKIIAYASALIEKSKGYLSIKNLTAAFIGYATLAFLISIALLNATNLSNWDSSFPLLLGNERTGNRPWRGYVSEVLIANRAIAEEEVQAFSNKRFFADIGDSLVASYQLTGKESYPDQTGQLMELSWRGTPPEAQAKMGVFLTPSHWLETKAPAALITEKIRETSQFTIGTTVATADTTQTGPARVVSLSGDTSHRNFTLGQQETDLVFRLRTPVTGKNGSAGEMVIPDVFADTNPHHLIITYSAPILHIYIDGLQNLHSFELTPEVTFFRYLFYSGSLNTFGIDTYKILYYAVIFIPLGSLIALIAIVARVRFGFYILLIGGGILLPSLVLEGISASGSGRGMNLENLLLSMGIAASAMVLVKVGVASKLHNVMN